jgi:hypothetical protein
MMFDRDYQLKLLNDVLNQRFSDADDLVNFVQNRTGKIDSSIITSYWLGQEHLINDTISLRAYIEFECSR